MVTISKDIDYRLISDEPTTFIKGRQSDPPIKMQLARTHLVVSKYFLYESFEMEGIPHRINAKRDRNIKMTLGRAQDLLADTPSLIRQPSCVLS